MLNYPRVCHDYVIIHRAIRALKTVLMASSLAASWERGGWLCKCLPEDIIVITTIVTIIITIIISIIIIIVIIIVIIIFIYVIMPKLFTKPIFSQFSSIQGPRCSIQGVPHGFVWGALVRGEGINEFPHFKHHSWGQWVPCSTGYGCWVFLGFRHCYIRMIAWNSLEMDHYLPPTYSCWNRFHLIIIKDSFCGKPW